MMLSRSDFNLARDVERALTQKDGKIHIQAQCLLFPNSVQKQVWFAGVSNFSTEATICGNVAERVGITDLVAAVTCKTCLRLVQHWGAKQLP